MKGPVPSDPTEPSCRANVRTLILLTCHYVHKSPPSGTWSLRICLAIRDPEFNRHLKFAWPRTMLIQHSNTGSMFSLVAHKKLFATLAMFVLLLVSYQMVSLPEHVPTEEPLPIDDTT